MFTVRQLLRSTHVVMTKRPFNDDLAETAEEVSRIC